MERRDIERLLQSEQEEERLQGLKLLGRSGAPTDMQLIYAAMGDGSWRIRKEAAEFFLSLPRAGELAGEIIELLHCQDNAGLRNTAVEILVALGKEAIPFLREELCCPDQDVRKFALDILGDIGDSEALGPMLPALNDPDDNVKAAAAENLGKIGSPDAVEPLLESLGASGDLLFRFTILGALGQIGSPIPVQRLCTLQSEKLLQKALFDCLGRCGEADAIPVLLAGLHDPVRNVREAAATALDGVAVRCGEEVQALLAAKAGGEVPEALSQMLESGRGEVCRAAARLLGMTGDGRFSLRLLKLFNDPEMRDVAAQALVALGRTSACSLTSIWPEADNRTRAGLAYVLGEARCPGSQRLLLDGLSNPDPEVRVLAAQALGKIGDGDAVALLADLAGDPSGDVTEAALQALSLLGPRYPGAAMSAMRPLLQSEDPRKRTFGVLVLKNLRGEDVEHALVMAMKDEASLVRQAAIKALEGRVESRHLPALKLSLTDEDGEVRQRAVELLGQLSDPEAANALESAMMDEDFWVRTAALRAANGLGAEKGFDIAVAALKDPVGLVVIAALEALAEIAPERAIPHLEKALDHPDEEVVNTALNLLMRGADTSWITPARDRLINHPHWEVRINFSRILAESMGAGCRPFLESRVLVEGEDMVREHLLELLASVTASKG